MTYILVTGSAGFIGFHIAKQLLEHGYSVIGVDNFCDYYDVKLKEDRNSILLTYPQYHCVRADICDEKAIYDIFTHFPIEYVIHLAAQAGVRYSIENPRVYFQTNTLGFGNIIEIATQFKVKHFIYASSSSVYGANGTLPFTESQCVERPLSIYGATKKGNELVAYSYSHLFQIPTTGLRFFTVYGPWGRPDMAFFKFTKALYQGEAIDVYNNGDMIRDFTYIDDIIAGIHAILFHIPQETLPYAIYNIGNTKTVALEHCIDLLEKATQRRAIKRYLPMQDGDMYQTFSDVTALRDAVGYNPSTSVEVGIPRFIEWYKEYYADRI